MKDRSEVERRRASRLKNGATQPCADCGGVLEFRESYLVLRPDRKTVEPAWVCLNRRCDHRKFVRA